MNKQSQIFELDKEIVDAKRIVEHWAGRSTRGKTSDEIVHIDERFFWPLKS